MTIKYTKNCPYCGSDDILVDAYAAWDIETQKWTLHATYDDACCNWCGETFDCYKIETKEMESNNA